MKCIEMTNDEKRLVRRLLLKEHTRLNTRLHDIQCGRLMLENALEEEIGIKEDLKVIDRFWDKARD